MTQATVVRVSSARTARAEAAWKRDQKDAERVATETSFRYEQEHKRSEVQAQAARMGIMAAWPSLRAAIGWFRREWQGALPRAMHEGADTVEPEDALGAPALTDRWRSYLLGQAGTGDAPEPIRQALRDMATGDNRYERCAAAFLFTMACLDFDPTTAGLRVKGHCMCDPERDEDGRFLTPHAAVRGCVMRILPLSPEFAPYYAQQAIDRLRERVVKLEKRGPRALPEPEWKGRLGIGLSESQAIAEAG